MADNIKRHGNRLRDYFPPRATIRAFIAVAEKDTDRVSAIRLGDDGALVVIKGWQEYEMFRQWAVRQKLMTGPVVALDENFATCDSHDEECRCRRCRKREAVGHSSARKEVADG